MLPWELMALIGLLCNFTAHFKVTVAVTVALTSLSCALRFFGNQRKCWQHLEGKFVINTVYRTREARNSEISKLQWEMYSSLCHNICSAARRAGASNGRYHLILLLFVTHPQDFDQLLQSTGSFILGNTSLRVWSYQRRYNVPGLSSQTNIEPISNSWMYMSCKTFEEQNDTTVCMFFCCFFVLVRGQKKLFFLKTNYLFIYWKETRSQKIWSEWAMTVHMALHQPQGGAWFFCWRSGPINSNFIA